jgi:hypothetical protein
MMKGQPTIQAAFDMFGLKNEFKQYLIEQGFKQFVSFIEPNLITA